MKEYKIVILVLFLGVLVSCGKKDNSSSGEGAGDSTIDGKSYKEIAVFSPTVGGKAGNVIIYDNSYEGQLVIYNVSSDGDSDILRFIAEGLQTTPCVLTMGVGNGNYYSESGKLTKKGNSIIFRQSV